MESSACLLLGTSRAAVLAAVMAVSSACVAPQAVRGDASGNAADAENAAVAGNAVGAATNEASASGRYDVGVALPDAPGREILVDQCLICHELTSLELFSGFYGRANWRSLVVTMRGNGAVLDDDEVETVTDYLTTYFGTGMP